MPRKSRTSLAGWRPGGEPDPLARARRAERWLAETLGLPALTATPAAPFDPTLLPVSRIDRDTLAHLATAVGSPADIDPFSRADHALGQGYADVLRRRTGRVDSAPDAILTPANRDAVREVIRIAGEKGLAVIPFGGGTGVAGGINAPPISGPPVVVLDMRNMDRVISVDPEDRRATAEAGIAGPALDQALAARGMTLGHTPQSYELSTLGGWVAAASTGLQPGLVGEVGDWLLSARVATPAGLWSADLSPAGSAGPKPGNLILGSAGTLGVILDATFRIRPLPAASDYRGFAFPDFAQGCAAIRELALAGIAARVLSLSDEDETEFEARFAEMRRNGGLRAGIARAFRPFRRAPARTCLAIVGLEGSALAVARGRQDADEIVRRHKGVDVGDRPGKVWLDARFQGPSLRDAFFDRGLGIDMLEVSATWSKLPALRESVKKAIADAIAKSLEGGPGRGIVMSRIGRATADGGSLVVTFLFPRKAGSELDQWHAIRHATGLAVREAGGMTEPGADPADAFRETEGEIGLAGLRAFKAALDPAGLLNPGKLGLTVGRPDDD